MSEVVITIARSIVLLLPLCWVFGTPLCWSAGETVFEMSDNRPDAVPGVSRRHIRYSFSLRNTTDKLVERGDLWVFGPVRQTAVQRCLRIETSHACELSVDAFGNQLMHFVFEDIPPRATRLVWVRADLMMTSEPELEPEATAFEHESLFTEPSYHMESGDPEIRAMAQALAADTAQETLKQAFSWVSSNIEYTGYAKGARGAAYALKHREGDCTEFAYLLAALCRARGIPARAVAGYVVESDGILAPEAFHNWTEVFDGRSWVLADAQKKVLGKGQEDYVTTRIITESEQDPMFGYQRFRYEGEGLVVKMD